MLLQEVMQELQGIPRKDPLFMHSCKVILQELAGILLQDSCKIPAKSHRNARKDLFLDDYAIIAIFHGRVFLLG